MSAQEKPLEGLALAIELVRIAADEAEATAPAEAVELRRISERLKMHRDGVKHVDYHDGVAEVWAPEEAERIRWPKQRVAGKHL